MAATGADGATLRLKLLLLSDLDGQIRRVTALCEHMVCSNDSDVNAVLVCGGLVAKREPDAYFTNEANAAAEGDMMAIISRLETIVCRVIYVPGENDPVTTRPTWEEETPNLTQYSVNCYAKTETLVPGIVVLGEERYVRIWTGQSKPLEAWDLAIVLRDSSAKSVVGRPQKHADNTIFDFHQLEIVGGPHQSLDSKAPIVFSGSLSLGQFTILNVEKRSPQGAWTIVSSLLLELPWTPDDDEDAAD